MNKALVLTAALLVMLTGGAGLLAAEQGSRELDAKNRDLRELQKAIKDKRAEKEKYLLQEKVIRRELARISSEMNRLEKEGEELRKSIRKAERNLAKAQKELAAAGKEKKQWGDMLDRETVLWFRHHHAYERLFSDPVVEKLRIQALVQKRAYLAGAENRERQWRDALEKTRKAQQVLLQLKTRHEKTMKDHARMREQKQDLLKTTSGRRIVAEDDIKRLSESSRALQQLIVRLEREKKKVEPRKEERKEGRERRKVYPWPVNGEVVSRFGKTKHPELDTYVINNGIRISAASGAEVHAVAAGEVIFSGPFRSYGLMVIVDHGDGVYSIYGQLGSARVSEDSDVKAGQVVGVLPAQDKPALYFELRIEGQSDDPLLWLK